MTEPNASTSRLPLYPIGRRASLAFDVVRALAALTVMIGHVRALFFLPFGQVTDPTLITRAFYFITGFGHQAVMVFFVLSGLLVGRSAVAAVKDNRWTWGHYLLRRLTRLYVVLLPALMLTIAWDSWGIRLFRATGVYSGLPSDSFILPQSITQNLAPPIFLGNLAFLMTVIVPPLGSNGPLWSLSNEFWYYILFPCLVVGIMGRSGTHPRLASLTTGILVAFFLPGSIVLYFAVWLFGVIAVTLPRRDFSHPRLTRLSLLGATAIFLTATASTRVHGQIGRVEGDFAIGIAFAVLLYVILCADSTPLHGAHTDEGKVSGIWKSFAGFSYTLYLVHLPPLVFAHAWLLSTGHSRWQPTYGAMLVALAIATIAIAYAFLISLLTERRTDQIRSTTERALRAMWRRVPVVAGDATD